MPGVNSHMECILSIIVVNHNGRRFLHDCLKSINEYAQCNHELIVVDNASTDGSCEYLREYFPQVRVIENDRNLGFSAGNNIGSALAQGELLLLLNNDTRLTTSLLPAIKEFAEDDRLGVLGCKIYHGDGGLQLSIGYELTPLRAVLSWTGLNSLRFAPSIFKRIENNEGRYATFRETAWLSGAFLMTRRSLWKKLGGLDERYFMYIEDVDYCKRVRVLGYKVAFTPAIEIIHHEGGGKAWIGEKALKDSMKSYVIYLKKFHNKHSPFFVRTGLGIIMIARALAYSIASFISGSHIYTEKKKAYFKTAQYLIGVADID